MTKLSILLLVCLGALAAAEASKALSRQKRSYVEKPWPDHHVPYYFDTTISEKFKIKYRGVMRMIEKHTCLRFYEKATQTSAHPDGSDPTVGYALFDTQSACRVTQNGYKSDGPNKISACSTKIIYLHEFGHLLGIAHDGRRYKRDELLYLSSDNIGNYYKSNWELETESKQSSYRQCDISPASPMQFDPYYYDEYGWPSHTFLIPNVPKISYESLDNFFKELNIANQCCGTSSCDQTSIFNEGYQANATGVCTTVCPRGLDPSTNCQEPRSSTPSAQWPFAIATLKLSSGCPASFVSSVLRMQGDGGNEFPSPSSLAGSQTASNMELHFCTKPSGTASPEDPGNYCFLRVDSSCPSGFHASSVTIQEQSYSGSSKYTDQANFPKGTFNTASSTLEFCCRRDGYSYNKLSLPTADDFTLFKVDGESCTPVEGMSVTEEKIVFDQPAAHTVTYVTASEAKPDFDEGADNKLTLKYCKYQAIDYNCGSKIDLDSSNTQATFTSSYPNGAGTNKECNWIINSEEGSRILLECTDPNVSAPDSLTYRKRVINEVGVPVMQNSDGKMAPILSMGNRMILTLRTGQTTNSGSGFTCTATLKSDANSPYTGRGEDYNGNMNYAVDEEGFHECLPWARVFERNPEAFVADENPDAPHYAEYAENYCRNPNGNRLRPYCATSVFQRNITLRYCDVEQHIPAFDLSTDCTAVLQADPTCSSRETKRVCFKTCKDSSLITDYPATEMKQTCGDPPLPTGTTNQNVQTTYNTGDKITVACSNSAKTSQFMCLSNGEWSTFDNFCEDSCSDGLTFVNQRCYALTTVKKTVASAKSFCQGLSANLAWAENETILHEIITYRSNDMGLENAKVWYGCSSLDGQTWVYDYNTSRTCDDSWLWKYGSGVGPTGKINFGARLRGAAVSSAANKTEVGSKTTSKAKVICRGADAGANQCLDFSPHCSAILDMNPQLSALQFARRWCPYTTGKCEASTCTVPTPATGVVVNAASVSTGGAVSYHCADSYTATGQGNTFRACKRDGTLTGQELVCVEKTQNRRQLAYYPLTDAPLATSEGAIIGGPSMYLSAQVASQVKGCGAYCRKDGTIKLQFYQIGSTPKTWILKSEREVTCLGGQANYWNFNSWSVAGNQFLVINDKTGAGVTYRSCTATKTNAYAKYIRNIKTPGITPVVDNSYNFQDYPQCSLLHVDCMLVPDTYTGSGFDVEFFDEDRSRHIIPGE